LLVLAGDPDARVRFQAAFSIGAITRDRPVQSLAKILERDVQDPWTQTAVLSSVNGVAGRLWLILVDPSSDFLQASGQAKAEFVARLASVIGARNDQDELRAFLQTLAVPADVPTPWWQMAALTGLADGIKQRGATLAAAVQELADSLRGAAAHVSQLLDAAKQIAQNAQRDLTERSSAIRLMGHMPFDQVADDFRGLLEPQQPQEIQLAAVQSLGTISDPRVAALLLEGWERYSPPVRREVLEAAFSRRERVAALLDAVEAGSIKATELDTARHAQLLNYPLKEIKTRAERLFAAQGTPNRKEVIESFRPLLTQTGDAVRGQNVFMKQCATCHRIAGAGQLVGPELTGLRSRSREAILMDMLDPNRALSPNYTNYLVATRDGRVLSGLIASETASSITLRRAEGAEDLLLRRDIESVRATGQSLMPEGLERNMTPEEMVDLIEFLKTVP
jgi:putative heme-binding domain-containing protein